MLCNKPIIYHIGLQKNVISFLADTKKEYRNININYNISQHRSEMVLLGLGNIIGHFLFLYHISTKKDKTPQNRYIENIGLKLEILYRFPKINIAQHYPNTIINNFIQTD